MYKEKPIPLVSVDSDGKYILQDEAVDFLRSLQGPIGVISVAGLYRTGKSYLLNRMLLNRSNGFGVGSTINACTKGIWVWGTPLKGQSPDGEPINIIIIDTEGIGAIDQDNTHDTKIFTLAILASSCFIYNSSGSIDQSAIQNLSLVVNLTKHIHLKTQSKDQEDPDDLAGFFPSFFWVVRDFSLQLVDTNGHSITSQQYLENALAVQKGQSMDIEEKNRIRKLLTTFFRQRQCFTLVRPHVDEDKLRELDSIGFDQLRPEFVEQVMTFRKRLLGRMKPKVLNQKKLSGEMYSSMMKNYVKAINDGAVPNIENAWNYMCREQCEKVSAEAFQHFETKLKQNLSPRYPCSEDEFNQAVRGAKNVAYDLFKKKAFGDNLEDFFAELKKRIKSKVASFRASNEKDSAAAIHAYIMKNFTVIQKKLKSQEYKTYSDFEKQLGLFYDQLIQKGPKLVNKQLICLQFMKKILPQGASFFFKNQQYQYDRLKTMSEERQINLTKQVTTYRDQMAREKTSATQRLYNVDKQKMEMTLKIENLQQQLNLLNKDKDSETQRISTALQNKTTQLESLKKSLQTKMDQISVRNDEMNSKLVTSEKQWDKDKAIYEQKVKLMTQQIEDLQKKEKIFDSTINSSKSQYSFELKESTLKFQKRISELSLQLNEYKDKHNETSEQLRTTKEEYDNTKEKFDKKQKKYKEDLSQKIKELERMKHEAQLDKNKTESEYLNDKEKVSKDLREMTDNFNQLQATIKSLNDSLKTQKNSYDKEIAIQKQKLQFSEENLRDTKQQLAEVKRNHEAVIQAMEETNGKLKDENENERIVQLKNIQLNKIKEIEIENEQIKRKMQFDIDTLNKAKNDLQLKITLLDSTLLKQRHQFQEIKKVSDQKIETLSSANDNIERLKNGKIKEQQVFFENKIRQLERELEELRDKASYEQRESHSKSEEAITQLKNYYEMEREKLQSKVGIEKQKAEKKLNKTVTQLQQKHKQELDTLEEQNDQLKEELSNLNSVMQDAVRDLEHDRDMKAKQIENLERNLFEVKENGTKKEQEMNAKYENLFQTSKSEKQVQYEKIELLQSENNSKQKVIMTLTHSRDQLETTLEKKEATLEEQKKEIYDLKSNFERTNDELKKKYQQLSNQYLEKKIEYEKSIALKTQQSEYNSRKAKDYERQVEVNSANFQQRIKAVKEECAIQVNASKEKEESIRITSQAKLQKLKKSSRQTESSLHKTVIELEKQKAIDTEKYQVLEDKYRDLEHKRTKQFEELSSQLSNLKENFSSDKKILQSDIDRYKIMINELENSKSELISSSDKDRILWENKLKFLEEQKESNKIQYSEKISRLETALENNQKNRINEKSSADANYNEIVSRLQKKYLNQIHSLNQEKTKRIMEHESAIKEFEMTIKNMTEKYELDIHSKKGSYQNVQKRLNQSLDNEKRLQTEVDKLRAEKQQKALDSQKSLEQEKEATKNKIKEIEEKCKKMETQKRSLFFEHEKEKAKWNYEEEHKKEKIENLLQKVEKNTIEIQKLQRQNERLKAEKKNNKVSAHPSFLNKYSNYGMDKSPMLNKSALGGVGDTTFVLNSSDIHSEENRENDPTLKPINM